MTPRSRFKELIMGLTLLTLLVIGASDLLASSSVYCGVAPIPPVGCEVIACQCDSDGNCEWIFYCD